VHLSGDTATATAVGGRRGTPVVLTVRAREAARSGVRFYRADNGVWLSDAVPGWFVEPPAGRQGNVRRTEGPPPT
jgi:putative RNA 2'-phosphotransferase